MPDFIDVEVISRGGKKSKDAPLANTDPLFALIAKLMDNVFQIPGTNIKFGLDPLIGLIPGIGDSSGAIISALLIVRGARSGLPRIVLARMALNVLVNALGGAIPVVGDIFSVWYKSNQLNYELYQKHVAGTNMSKKPDWFFVVILLLALLLVVGIIVSISIMLFAALWKFLVDGAPFLNK